MGDVVRTRLNDSEPLYRGPFLIVSRQAVQMGNSIFPAGTIANVRHSVVNELSKLRGHGIALFCIGCPGVVLMLWIMQNSPLQKYEPAIISLLLLFSFFAFGGVVLFAMGVHGRNVFVLTITANSGQYQSVNFLTERELQKASSAIQQAIGLASGNSYTVNVEKMLVVNEEKQSDWPEIR